MTALADKVDTPLTQEAFVLATMEAAHYKLLLGDHEGTKAGMDACEKVLDRLDSVDLAVHAAFYRVSGDYYKVRFFFRSFVCSFVSCEGELTCREDRRRRSMRITTRTRSSTSRASISTPSFPLLSARSEQRTWASRRSWARSTTLESWCVFLARFGGGVGS